MEKLMEKILEVDYDLIEDDVSGKEIKIGNEVEILELMQQDFGTFTDGLCEVLEYISPLNDGMKGFWEGIPLIHEYLDETITGCDVANTGELEGVVTAAYGKYYTELIKYNFKTILKNGLIRYVNDMNFSNDLNSQEVLEIIGEVVNNTSWDDDWVMAKAYFTKLLVEMVMKSNKKELYKCY